MHPASFGPQLERPWREAGDPESPIAIRLRPATRQIVHELDRLDLGEDVCTGDRLSRSRRLPDDDDCRRYEQEVLVDGSDGEHEPRERAVAICFDAHARHRRPHVLSGLHAEAVVTTRIRLRAAERRDGEPRLRDRTTGGVRDRPRHRLAAIAEADHEMVGRRLGPDVVDVHRRRAVARRTRAQAKFCRRLHTKVERPVRPGGDLGERLHQRRYRTRQPDRRGLVGDVETEHDLRSTDRYAGIHDLCRDPARRHTRPHDPVGKRRARGRAIAARERPARARSTRSSATWRRRIVRVPNPQDASTDEQQEEHEDHTDQLLHRDHSHRGGDMWRARQLRERHERGEPATFRRVVAPAERLAELDERDLQAAAHRAVGNTEPSRDLRARAAFEEMKQHRRAIWLGERQHFAGECTLELDALDQLRRRRRRASLVVRGVPAVTPRLARSPRAREVRDDAREPRPEWPVRIRLLPLGDEPGVLRDIVGERVVADQRPGKLADPAHLGHQLLAARNPRGVHSPLSLAGGATVRENRDADQLGQVRVWSSSGSFGVWVKSNAYSIEPARPSRALATISALIGIPHSSSTSFGIDACSVTVLTTFVFAYGEMISAGIRKPPLKYVPFVSVSMCGLTLSYQPPKSSQVRMLAVSRQCGPLMILLMMLTVKFSPSQGFTGGCSDAQFGALDTSMCVKFA